MRRLLLIAIVLLACPALAQAADRRSHIEQDECAKGAAACEKRCDEKPRAERLTCKTDCRFAETECRNKKH